MTRGKSLPSELILEIIKSNNSFNFFKMNLEREIISFLSKYYLFLFLHIYFNKNGKTQQNKSLYGNIIEIFHFYTSL